MTFKLIDGNPIGRGAYSDVYKGILVRDPNVIIAIKQVYLKKISKKRVDKEIEIMRKLCGKHVNIIDFYGSEYDEKDKCVYIFLEYCDQGPITNLKKPMSEKESMQLFDQIVQGIKVLRNKGILHRDIKPDNILLKTDIEGKAIVKITDFGFAKETDGSLMETICGSPLYMAPEIMDLSGYTDKTDIWSLGLILYEFIIGENPFKQAKNPFQLREIIKKWNIEEDKQLKSKSEDIQLFIRGMLQKDLSLRYSWTEIYSNDTFIKIKLPSSAPIDIVPRIDSQSQLGYYIRDDYEPHPDSPILVSRSWDVYKGKPVALNNPSIREYLTSSIELLRSSFKRLQSV